MKNKKDTRKREDLKAFATFPLADAHTKDPVSNATKPSEDDVTTAKHWVDFNEK